MILFWDTETTGLPDDRLPPDHEAQPYIVQLAAQLCRDDGAAVAGFSLIVDPGISNGVFIPERASAVHGITNEIAVQFGCSAEFALSAFSHLYQRADIICAHNAKFDKAVTETAIARHYGRIMPLRKQLFCTMEAATPIVNLPPSERMKAVGIDKPKPPKLEEATQFFFGHGIERAHDAMADTQACAKLFFYLRSLDKPK